MPGGTVHGGEARALDGLGQAGQAGPLGAGPAEGPGEAGGSPEGGGRMDAGVEGELGGGVEAQLPFLAEGVLGEAQEAFVEAVVVGQDGPAFADVEELAVGEGEDEDVGPGAGGPSVAEGPQGAGAVVDEEEAVLVGQSAEAFVVGGEAVGVLTEDGPGMGVDEAADGFGVEGEGFVEVGEGDPAAQEEPWGEGTAPATGGSDEAVAGAEACGQADQEEARGGVGDEEGVAHPGEAAELGLPAADGARARVVPWVVHGFFSTSRRMNSTAGSTASKGMGR